MGTLVVCESMFGNTRRIAEAIADGATGGATVVDVADAPDRLPPDVTLLLVGGPTHAFSMSRPSTRDSARTQGAPVPPGPGVREWIAALPAAPDVLVHTFDTRVKVRGMPGSAARAMRRALRKAGFTVGKTETFWVTGTPGPLADGELARARAWAAALTASHPQPR